MRKVRGLDLHITRWGPEPSNSRPPVVLLHGWQDTADTFQFMVDAFEQDWPLVALDWRGCGRSSWSQDGYWFPDYYADLDALLDQLSPNDPVQLVGHSMGGNIAGQYAGIRPERVSRIAALEGFGLRRTMPVQAPSRLRKWLSQVGQVPPLKQYDSFEQLATIIAFRYPRFPPERVQFIARAWAAMDATGRVRLLGDSRHRWISPILARREESEAVWRNVAAPFLLVVGDNSTYWPELGEDGTEEVFRALIPHIEIAYVAGAGHMLHIERPEIAAPLVEKFLSGR